MSVLKWKLQHEDKQQTLLKGEKEQKPREQTNKGRSVI